VRATARNGVVSISFTAHGHGRPVVLLHGFSLDGDAWSDMGYIGPLIDAGFRPILLDIRGHGNSSKPHDPNAYTEEAQARDIAAVLDALGIVEVDLIGYSRGGRMALDFASFHPDRIGRLIVGGAHPFLQDMSLFRNALRGGIEGWLAVVEQFGGPLPADLRKRICGNDLLALRAAVAEDRPDRSAALADFERPCLFIVGTEDPLRPQIRKAADVLPRAFIEEIPGCNHMTALQRSDLFLPPVLEFLREGLSLRNTDPGST
jgi:pimeloyl-ACP methyl ester carboxylesterase